MLQRYSMGDENNTRSTRGLLRRIKLVADAKQKTIEETATEFLEVAVPKRRTRSHPLPPPLEPRGRGPLTVDEIEAAINFGRD